MIFCSWMNWKRWFDAQESHRSVVSYHFDQLSRFIYDIYHYYIRKIIEYLFKLFYEVLNYSYELFVLLLHELIFRSKLSIWSKMKQFDRLSDKTFSGESARKYIEWLYIQRTTYVVVAFIFFNLEAIVHSLSN